MKSIVATGGTRGIGFGLAREFSQRGPNVTICGRHARGVDGAVAVLEPEPSGALGMPCDVGGRGQVQGLWDAAVARFGGVDVWINNAGVSSPRRVPWELPAEVVEGVVRTNVLGVMHGSGVAMRGMPEQGRGQIYNTEGLGSDGTVLRGSALYGATKSAITYFTRGPIKDAKGTPVRVCFLGPGMVTTDLLLGEGDPDAGTRRVINILADRVETVAPYLVEKILTNDRHGAHRVAAEAQRGVALREGEVHRGQGR